MKNKYAAFTLIELLVVIAIIAILAAILFPVFAQAKAAAKKTQDLSNIKNLNTAVMIYGADYDDYFPRHEYKANQWLYGSWSVPVTWREQIMPYVKNGDASYTDGSSTFKVADGGIYDTPEKPGSRGSYTMNRNITPGRCYWDVNASNWLCDSNDNGVRDPNVPVQPSVSQTALDAPAQIASMFTIGINPDWNASGDYSEASWWWFGGAQWPPDFTGPNSHIKWDADSNQSPSWSIPRYRYTKGLNRGFADGHAKWVRKGDFNWCRDMYVKGFPSDRGDNWDWLFDPGQPCAAYAR